MFKIVEFSHLLISEYIKNYSGCDTQMLPEDQEKATEESTSEQDGTEQNTETTN